MTAAHAQPGAREIRRVMHGLRSPEANIYVDFATSLAVVSELADPALRLAWLSPGEKAQIALGIGLAGVSCANEVPRFTNGLRVETVHNAVTRLRWRRSRVAVRW